MTDYRNPPEQKIVWLGALLILIGSAELIHISFSWLKDGVASFWTICNLTGVGCTYYTTSLMGLNRIIHWFSNISIGAFALIGTCLSLMYLERERD